MRSSIVSLILCATAFSSPAFAEQGEVCTTEPLRSTIQQPVALVNNEIKFNCPSIGEVSIPEVYQKGWRVVQTWAAMVPKPDDAPATNMMYSSYIALIEKI